jgi:hypothetical protein
MTHSEFTHLLSSVRGLSPEQLRQLRQQLDSELSHQEPRRAAPPKKQPARTPARKARRAEPGPPARMPLPVNDPRRAMMESGLILSLPDPALDIDDDDPDDAPVVIKGEPLSETILRERR